MDRILDVIHFFSIGESNYTKCKIDIHYCMSSDIICVYSQIWALHPRLTDFMWVFLIKLQFRSFFIIYFKVIFCLELILPPGKSVNVKFNTTWKKLCTFVCRQATPGDGWSLCPPLCELLDRNINTCWGWGWA